MARVYLIYLEKKYKTLNILNELGLSWKSAENNILLEIQSIESVLQSINRAKSKVTNTSTAT